MLHHSEILNVTFQFLVSNFETLIFLKTLFWNRFFVLTKLVRILILMTEIFFFSNSTKKRVLKGNFVIDPSCTSRSYKLHVIILFILSHKSSCPLETLLFHKLKMFWPSFLFMYFSSMNNKLEFANKHMHQKRDKEHIYFIA